jgi:hypothetical protein
MSSKKLVLVLTICGGITVGTYMEEQHCQARLSYEPILVKHCWSAPALPHEPLAGISIPTSPGMTMPSLR